MKNFSRHLLFLLTFLIISLSLNAQEYYASDLGWTCVGRDSFMIRLTVYRACNSIPSSGTQNIFVQCYPGSIFDTVSVTNISVADVTPTCRSSCTRCSSSTCIVPYGIEQLKYTGLLVIPSSVTCCDIKISTSIGTRPLSITTGAAGQAFYTYAIFNRCQTMPDNSPEFSEIPMFIRCIGLDWIYNPGLTDRDTNSSGGLSDEFTYIFTSPMTSATTATTYVTTYSYSDWLYYWGFPGSSMSFPRGMHVDYITGDISLRPMKIEQSLTTLQIDEYRNGVQIGEIRRELFAIIINCPSNHSPSLGPSLYYKEVCAGSPVTFTITSNDPDVNDTVSISWNHGIQGGSWSDNNGTTKHPTGVFTWTPANNQISPVPYTFLVTAKDNVCPFNVSYNHQYQVLVKPNPIAEFRITDSCGGKFWFEAINSNVTAPVYTWYRDTVPEKFRETGQTISHQFTTTGKYRIKINVRANGCSKEFYDSVKVDSFLYARLPEDTTLCFGVSLMLNASVFNNHGPVKYNWSTSPNDSLDHIGFKTVSSTKITAYVTDTSGCRVSDNINIKANVLPNPNVGPDTTICLNDIATLTAYNGCTYNWSNGQKTPAIQVSPTKTDTFSVLVTNQYNCVSIDTIIVHVNPLPVAKISGNNSVCYLQALTLLASGGSAYEWNNGDSTPEIKFLPFFSDYYKVTVTDSNGCRDSDSIYVTVNPLPFANAGIDTNICRGQSAFLSASGGMFYIWNTGDTNASITVKPISSQYYRVQVSDSNLCYTSASVHVEVLPSPWADAGKDTAFCAGATVVLTASGGKHYLWNTNETTASIKVTPANTSYYKVFVRDSNVCITEDSVLVTVHPIPLADAGAGKNGCIGQSTTLTASGGDYYHWNTGDSTATIHFIASVSAYYRVNVKNIYGCEANDSVLLSVWPVPTAGFEGSPLSGIVPLQTTFIDSSHISSGKIVQYIWNFGDITGATGSIAQHIYNLSGNYDVRLVVISDNKCSDTVKKEKYIRVQPSGIEKTQKNQKIIISPNPGNCVIFVKVVNEENRIISLRLTDIFGREVVTMKNLHSESVKIDSPGKGIYYLQAWLEGGSLVSGRLIFE